MYKGIKGLRSSGWEMWQTHREEATRPLREPKDKLSRQRKNTVQALEGRRSGDPWQIWPHVEALRNGGYRRPLETGDHSKGSSGL